MRAFFCVSVTHLNDLPSVNRGRRNLNSGMIDSSTNRLHTQIHIPRRKKILWIYCSNTLASLQTPAAQYSCQNVSLHFIKARLLCSRIHTHFNNNTHTFSSGTCLEVYHLLNADASSLDQSWWFLLAWRFKLYEIACVR